MAKMAFDEEGFLKEPCLSCNKCYTEDIWDEWCCDEKICLHNTKEVLDKIRIEIETLPRELPTDSRNMVRRTRVLSIIDKYRGKV